MQQQPNRTSVSKPVIDPQRSRYIDFKTDFAFKHLLSKEPHLDLLKNLLNGIFKGRKIIEQISISKSEHQGDQMKDRKTIFDVICTDHRGNKFVVEMQRGNRKFFKDRILYYTANLIQEQGESVKADWEYELPEIYFIAIMDFRFKNIVENLYIHDVRMIEVNSGVQFYDKLGYIFIELPGFNKTADQLNSDEDNWLFCLKHLGKLTDIPLPLSENAIFKKLFKIAEVSNLNDDDMNAYERELKRKRDNYSHDMFIREEAAEQGLEKGLQRGIEIGQKNGLEKKSHEVIVNMLSKTNLSDLEITDLVNVPLELVIHTRQVLKK